MCPDSVVEEVRAFDLAAAGRDTRSYRCEACKAERGSQWFDRRWLCRSCRAEAWRKLYREVYGPNDFEALPAGGPE